MALFKWFVGRSAADQEQRADTWKAEQAWGKAKLQYEKALDKLELESEPDSRAIARLKDKVKNCCKQLSAQHIQSGRDLLEAGYNTDAAELFDLALELCDDPATHKLIQDLLRQTATDPKPEPTAPPAPLLNRGQADLPSANESVEDHFSILCSMLPEDLQAIYAGYGPAFREGYVALHQGEFERAAELLDQAHQALPDKPSYILLELAGALFNLSRIDEARALMEGFVQSCPEALPGYELLCEIYWEQKDFKSARLLLEGCPQEQKESAAYVVLFGETLGRAAEYEAARDWYTDHLQKHGWNDKIGLGLAAVYEQFSKTELALELYTRYISNCRGCGSRTPPEIERKYADLNLAHGIISDEILEIYLSLAQKDPANATEYYLNASRIYANRGNQREARRFEQIAAQYRTGS